METRSTDANIFPITQFKSYYVVWKHEKEVIEIKKKIGLNRTM